MECNKLLQQQLEALVHGGGSKGSTDSASAAGPPGASSSGSSAWALHGSALGAALLLRWVTYSHGDHHQNLAHRMLEDKALMVFAWPVSVSLHRANALVLLAPRHDGRRAAGDRKRLPPPLPPWRSLPQS